MTEDRRFLENSILRTIVFYDILGLPLTGFEIYKYLIGNKELRIKNKELKFSDILETLDKSDFLKGKIGGREGFYFLRGKDYLVEERIEKQKLADLKWKKLRRAAKFFWVLPFLKTVLVTGSFALGNVKPRSDFDVLVAARHGRIWTLRFLATILFYFFGIRRSAKKIKDRICLSHYVSDRALQIRCRNIYEAQYYARAFPLLEVEPGFYFRFCRENYWIGDYLVFWPPEIRDFQSLGAVDINLKSLPQNKFLRFFGGLAEKILAGALGDFLERILAAVQKFHINRHPLKHLEGERSRVDEYELEFRPNSHSLAIVGEYEKKILGS
ncbi:MAG: nucleotidyltransferase domain-containing protein [bacterium]|nr:nucleotidyltransferase domain-containing protein [bacterium]